MYIFKKIKLYDLCYDNNCFNDDDQIYDAISN